MLPPSLLYSMFGASHQLAIWAVELHGEVLQALAQFHSHEIGDGSFRARSPFSK